MYRFFVNPEQLQQEPIRIGDEDYNHIHNVLRMKPGEEVLVTDQGEKEYLCEIIEYDTDMQEVLLKIVDIFGNNRELPAKIILFQGYPKGDKMEQIVQKAVELGVAEVVPVMMKRCVVKLDDKKAAKKIERLNGVALSAAKQSKRGRIPEVKPVMSMEDAVPYASTLDHVIVPYESAEGMEYSKKVIEQVTDGGSIGIFIGPEGGFEPTEIEKLSGIDAKILSLGHRILRTETAGMVVLSLLMFALEK